MKIGSQINGFVSLHVLIIPVRLTDHDAYTLACFTDIGMPAGQTQDGTWNVNMLSSYAKKSISEMTNGWV